MGGPRVGRYLQREVEVRLWRCAASDFPLQQELGDVAAMKASAAGGIKRADGREFLPSNGDCSTKPAGFRKRHSNKSQIRGEVGSAGRRLEQPLVGGGIV